MTLRLLGNEVEDAKIQFIEDDATSIIKNVQAEVIDIGLIPIYEENQQHVNMLHVRPITPISYYVFVSKSSHLATYERIELESLIDESIILFEGSFLKWSYNLFSSKNPDLSLLFTSTNQELIREMIKENQGITIDTIAEAIVNPYVETGDIISIPLNLDFPIHNYLGMITNKNSSQAELFQKIYIMMNKYINEEILKVQRKISYDQ